MCKVIQHREAVGEYKILIIVASMKNKRQLIPKNNYPKIDRPQCTSALPVYRTLKDTNFKEP